MNRKLTQKEKNNMLYIGTYTEQDLKENKDKKELAELEKENGVKLFGVSEILTDVTGYQFLELYAMTKEQYIASDLL